MGRGAGAAGNDWKAARVTLIVCGHLSGDILVATARFVDVLVCVLLCCVVAGRVMLDLYSSKHFCTSKSAGNTHVYNNIHMLQSCASCSSVDHATLTVTHVLLLATSMVTNDRLLVS